jgi:2-methylisocitrate lyase-like PEP mutase family enzyme
VGPRARSGDRHQGPAVAGRTRRIEHPLSAGRPPFLRDPLPRPGEALRRLLDDPRITIAPGAADALTARLIEEAGFGLVYVTGAGIANVQHGVPDVGLLGLEEVLRIVRAIVSVVGVPVLVDADTGFGGSMNVARTVRELEKAGAAGVQLEDQVMPKRCGHFEGKQVVPAEEMVARLAAARMARMDPSFVIVARTDARQTHGLDEALDRGRRYAAAGADAIFVEALESEDELARVRHEVPSVPLVVNLVHGGKTPILPADVLEKLGFSMALYANLQLCAAIFAVRRALDHLRDTGSSAGLEAGLASWAERQSLVGLAEVEALEAALGTTHDIPGVDLP